MEWIERYAELLGAESGQDMAITEAEVEAVLDLARVVAHGTERRNAPLAAYLAGRFAAARAAAGVPPAAAAAVTAATVMATDLFGSPPVP